MLSPVAAVAVDAAGREQPLQLVLTPDGVRRLLDAVGPGDGNHLPVRPLVRALDPIRRHGHRPGVVGRRHARPAAGLAAAGRRLRPSRSSPPCVPWPRARAVDPSRPVVVALDGRSGAGKSVLAQAVALHTGGCVLDGDDFYAPRLDREGLVAARRGPSPSWPATG